MVSTIGLGCNNFGRPNTQTATQDGTSAVINTAIDAGITLFDTADIYGGANPGLSETLMGVALKGRRDEIVLATKFGMSMAGLNGPDWGAFASRRYIRRAVESSLTRLQTDWIDLYQLHRPDGITPMEETLAALGELIDEGKIRYIGFTGHKDPAVHLRMLEIAQKHNFHFDTVQMPINVMDAHFRSFTKEVMPVALKQGIGVLAMKTFGDHFILNSNTVQPIEALHYGLTQPVSVVITGIDNTQTLDQAFEAARTFKPLDQAQISSLLARTATAASEGKFELFKTTNHFDGTAQNPKWLG